LSLAQDPDGTSLASSTRRRKTTGANYGADHALDDQGKAGSAFTVCVASLSASSTDRLLPRT
jgi:hypothetical protein